jgi:hypothetical protein
MMQLSSCANCTCLRPQTSSRASLSASPTRYTTSYSPVREYQSPHSPPREDVLEREALLRELRVKDMEIRRLKEQLKARPEEAVSPPPQRPVSSVDHGTQTVSLTTSSMAVQTEAVVELSTTMSEAPHTLDVVSIRKELDTLRSRDQMKSKSHAALEAAHRELKQHTMVLEKATTDMEGPLGAALDLLSKRFVQA